MLSAYRAGVGFANACITLPDNSRMVAENPPETTEEGRDPGAVSKERKEKEDTGETERDENVQ